MKTSEGMIHQKSDLALTIHYWAMLAAELVERREREMGISPSGSIAIYRNQVIDLVLKRLLDELEPIHKELARLAAMRQDLSKPNDPPPEVRELMDNITKKWGNVAKELLNGPHR